MRLIVKLVRIGWGADSSPRIITVAGAVADEMFVPRAAVGDARVRAASQRLSPLAR